MTLAIGKRNRSLTCRRSAFSLFELLLALALLAVLASITVPAVRSWQSRIEFDRANGALIELIAEARRRAVREGNSWNVRIVKAPASLTLEPLFVSAVKPRPNRSSSDDTRFLPNSIQIEFLRMRTDQKLDALLVNSHGKVAPGRIWISQDGIRVRAYEIDRLTGGIRQAK